MIWGGAELQRQGTGVAGWEMGTGSVSSCGISLPLPSAGSALSSPSLALCFASEHPAPSAFIFLETSLASESHSCPVLSAVSVSSEKILSFLRHLNSLQCCVLQRVQTSCAKVECFGGNDESHSH